MAKQEGLIAYRFYKQVEFDLFLHVSRLCGDPVRNVRGTELTSDVLAQNFRRQERSGPDRTAFLIPRTEITPGRAPAWSLALTGTHALQLTDGVDAYLEFDVLRRAQPRLATFGSFDPFVDLGKPEHVDLYLRTAALVPPAIDAEYAIGGNVHDFVDPSLERPLDRAWPVMFFRADRAKSLPLDRVPPGIVVERTPDGGAWLRTGENPFVVSAQRDRAVEELGKALGFPLQS